MEQGKQKFQREIPGQRLDASASDTDVLLGLSSAQ
jgi:hypothetical protein